jgi:hypothetical protein
VEKCEGDINGEMATLCGYSSVVEFGAAIKTNVVHVLLALWKVGAAAAAAAAAAASAFVAVFDVCPRTKMILCSNFPSTRPGFPLPLISRHFPSSKAPCALHQTRCVDFLYSLQMMVGFDRLRGCRSDLSSYCGTSWPRFPEKSRFVTVI